MSEPPLALALWGLLGAFPYAGQKLITALWAEREPTARQTKRAWAEWLIALLFAPGAAVALTPIVVRLSEQATEVASAFGIGMAANACRPILIEVVIPTFRRVLGGYLTELGSKLTGDKA